MTDADQNTDKRTDADLRLEEQHRISALTSEMREHLPGSFLHERARSERARLLEEVAERERKASAGPVETASARGQGRGDTVTLSDEERAAVDAREQWLRRQLLRSDIGAPKHSEQARMKDELLRITQLKADAETTRVLKAGRATDADVQAAETALVAAGRQVEEFPGSKQHAEALETAKETVRLLRRSQELIPDPSSVVPGPEPTGQALVDEAAQWAADQKSSDDAA